MGHIGCRKVSRRLGFTNCQRLLPALTAAPATPSSASAGIPPLAAGRGGPGRGLRLAAAACQPRVSVSFCTFVLGKQVHLGLKARERQYSCFCARKASATPSGLPGLGGLAVGCDGSGCGGRALDPRELAHCGSVFVFLCAKKASKSSTCSSNRRELSREVRQYLYVGTSKERTVPAARIVANSREVRVDVGEEGGGGVVLVGGGAYGRLPEYTAYF